MVEVMDGILGWGVGELGWDGGLEGRWGLRGMLVWSDLDVR